MLSSFGGPGKFQNGSIFLDCRGNQFSLFSKNKIEIAPTCMPLIADLDDNGTLELIMGGIIDGGGADPIINPVFLLGLYSMNPIKGASAGGPIDKAMFTSQYQLDAQRSGCLPYPKNRRPKFEKLSAFTFNVNTSETLEFTVSAIDPDANDILTYNLDSLTTRTGAPTPGVFTFSGQTFYWRPGTDLDYTEEGIYDVCFRVTDGDYYEYVYTAIDVIYDGPPEFYLFDPDTYAYHAPPVVIEVEYPDSVKICVDMIDSDTDPGDLVVEIDSLPSGATFGRRDPSTPMPKLFEWTPSTSDIGEHLFTFTGSDGCSSVRESITISVVDRITYPPVMSIIDKVTSMTLAAPIELEVGCGDTIDLSIELADTDTLRSDLAIDIDILPLGAVFANADPACPVPKTFTWTPATADIGDHWITFSGSDEGAGGGYDVSETVYIKVVKPSLVLSVPPSPASGSITISVETKDPEDIYFVVLLCDGLFVRTMPRPFEFKLDTTQLADGIRTFKVRGRHKILQEWIESDSVTLEVRNNRRPRSNRRRDWFSRWLRRRSGRKR